MYNNSPPDPARTPIRHFPCLFPRSPIGNQIVNVATFNFQISKLPISKFQKPTEKLEIRHTDLQTSFEFQILRYEKIICFRYVPIFFLYLLKYFGDKYGLRGSRFGHIFGRPKNVLKVLQSIRNH